MREPVEKLVKELIDGVLPKGKCDLILEIAEVLPLKIFLDFADLPRTDFERLRPLSSPQIRKDLGMTDKELIRLVDEYLGPVVAKRMKKPEQDSLSRIISEPILGKPVTFKIAMAMSRDVLLASFETVSSHIGFIGYHLAQYPEHRKSLIERPTLLPLALNDLIRRYNAVTIIREAVNDTKIGSVVIKKGDVLCLPLALYNLDDRLFSDPLDVMLDRQEAGHLGFGAGIHRCPGNSLARIELMVFITEWLARIPNFSIDNNYPVRTKTGITGSLQNLHLVWPSP